MPSKNIVCRFCFSFGVLLTLASTACAEDWRNLVQPIGSLVSVESAGTVNDRLGGRPPFEASTDVTTIRTATPQYFVRFYNPTAAENPSNPIGSWVMRSAEVRGLTAAQVRDIFALPAMPTMMTMVLVPTGSNMYTGIAAPITGWGSGGAQQSKLIGPPWVPSENFINQQAIGNCVLCYRVLAPNGNANLLASFLDTRIPAAYSDLETVYSNLDLLYYGSTSAQFKQAINQISPIRYDNLATDGVQANVLFNDVIDQRVTAMLLGGKAFGLPSEYNGQERKNAWVQVAGSSQRAGNLGFNTQSSGIFAGADASISPDMLLGFSASFVRSDLNWSSGLGGVKTDYAKAGIYAAWLPGNWLIQGGVNAGTSQSDASRRLTFATLDRNATASPDGWEGNARLRIGYRLPFDSVAVIPTATLDYFYQRRDAFVEKGADSLNLQVQSIQYRTLRSHVGVNVSWEKILQNGQVLTPQFQLGWAHERLLGDRALTARLDGQSDSFTVYGNTKANDMLTAGAGINLIAGKRFSLFARYNLEYRREFQRPCAVGGVKLPVLINACVRQSTIENPSHVGWQHAGA